MSDDAKSLTSTQALKLLRQEYGDDFGDRGLELAERERIPFGILAMDIATGGGIPRNRMTMIYGPESSCKTNLALSLIREHQKRWPKLTCAFIDVEGTLDRVWMEQLGVDVDRLIVLRPDYGEQAVKAAEEFILAEDVGIVAIDSIAAMAAMQEMSREADENDAPGTQGRLVSKLVKRTTSAMKRAEKDGRGSTLVWINQTRSAIGVMRGNPETIPGGQAQRFMASMRIRVSKRSDKAKEVDKKIHPTLPTWKIVRALMEKYKVPVVERETTFAMCMIPHKGLKAGQANDWPQAQRYMKELGLWDKTGKGYRCMGQEFKTVDEARRWFLSDPARVDGFVRQVVSEHKVTEPQEDAE